MRFVGRVWSTSLVSRNGGRSIAWLTSVAIVAPGVSALLWVVLSPPAAPRLSLEIPESRVDTDAGSGVVPPLSVFAPVWSTRLRRPAVRKAVRPAVQTKKKRPAAPPVRRPDVKLLGVYGGRFAVFRAAGSGMQEVTVTEGERIGDAVVVRIGAEGAVLERNGVPFRFALQRSDRGRGVGAGKSAPARPVKGAVTGDGGSE